MGVNELAVDAVTILIIEDGDDLREDIAEMLRMENYQTYTAENGTIGIQMAKNIMPHLIICDIMMPELDGFGVLEALRADHETATIPFIFLTARTEHVDQRQAMILGANDYLKKPFQPQDLLDTIQAQLIKRRQQLESVKQHITQLTENIATALPHEVRTPLNTIIGFSEMLQSEAVNLKEDQITSWAKHISDASYRLYHLIENYLYYVRSQVLVTNGTNDNAEASMTDMDVTLEMQAMAIAQRCERESDLTLEIDPAPKLYLEHKDGNKIAEELLDNAFKFSKVGQTVTVQAFIAEDRYVVRVSDQGRGMTREQIDSIGGFMQFDRWLHEQQGMGLGLAVVKLLAEIYQADFLPTSEVEKGTTIELRFKTK